MIKSFIKESIREIEGIERIANKLKVPLINPDLNPKGTMALYFGTREFSRVVDKFLEIKKTFISLDLFRDEFDRCEYFKVTSLNTLSHIVQDDKNFDGVFDREFMDSKHSLILWRLNYKDLFFTLRTEIADIRERFDQAHENWYNKHKYMITDEVFVNKDNFAIYRIKNINYDNNLITIEKCDRNSYTQSKSLMIHEFTIQADKIRESIEDEAFIYKEMGTIHPDLFL
jgi:hypothetical protein